MHRLSTRGAALLALAALAGGLLVGCAGEPAPSPSWSDAPDAAEPLFASDEEALAAAEAAYEALRVASGISTASGGSEIGHLDTVATGQALEYELDGAAGFKERKLRTVGDPTSSYRLRSSGTAADGQIEIWIYVCDDITAVDVLDSTGTSVVKADRQALLPYEVAVTGPNPQSLLVSVKQRWTGGNFC